MLDVLVHDYAQTDFLLLQEPRACVFFYYFFMRGAGICIQNLAMLLLLVLVAGRSQQHKAKKTQQCHTHKNKQTKQVRQICKIMTEI